jgi:hypothetical protein
LSLLPRPPEEVAVIDNTTGVTLQTCEVTATTKNHGENTGVGGTAAAGDNIEVKVTAPGSRCNNRAAWRVRFRY